MPRGQQQEDQQELVSKGCLQIRANLCGEWRDCSYVIVRTRPIYYSWRWARGTAAGSRGNRGGGSLCCLPPTQPWADGRFLLYDSVCVRIRKYRPTYALINMNNHAVYTCNIWLFQIRYLITIRFNAGWKN